MSRFLSRIRLSSARRFESQSLRKQGIESLDGVEPLYDRRPPWWTRWTYFLVGADLVITVSAAELVWSHWTRWEPLPEGEAPASGPSPVEQASASAPRRPAQTAEASSGDESEKQVKGHYVLRPWWHRAPTAGGQLFLGIAIAGLILGSRSRIIRRLYVLPPASSPSGSSTAGARGSPASAKSHGFPEDSRVVLQCANHFRSQGRVVPKRDCTLERGKDGSELILWVDKMRGHYWFGIEDAIVNGRKLPLQEAREEIFKRWFGSEKGRKMSVEERWKSGPVLKST